MTASGAVAANLPPILDAAVVLARADASQGRRLSAFLEQLPSASIKPSIVPKIGDEPWAKDVFAAWQKDSAISTTVKRAIKARAT